LGFWKARNTLAQHDFMLLQCALDESLLAIAEYISGNPVCKGLAAAPEDWPWNAD
jgi:hypothetical protein